MEDVELAVKLSEILRHPEDLDKLSSLQSEFSRKKAHVDSQLKAGLKTQLEVTESGMSAINNGQRTINLIKEEMIKIDKMCKEAQDMILEFPMINKISKIHKNFMMVEEMKRNLQGLDKKLDLIDRMLEEDAGEDINNPMPNLLPIHYYITQLRNFKDEAMFQSQNADEDVRATLESYFAPLADRIELFDERLGVIGMNIIELVKAGNHGLVVRAAKVIDAEERSDDRVDALIAAQNSQKDLQLNFNSVKTGPKVKRGYKEKFFSCIEAALEARFDDVKARFLDDPEGLAESLGWYFDDLYIVKTQFPKLMPPRWKIFDIILGTYHRQMNTFLKSIAATPDLDGQSLLVIILWVSEYNKQMKSLGIKAADLQPRLFDGDEGKLIKEYLNLIVSSMNKWMDKIIEDDTAEFLSRAKPLDPDDSGKTGMQGPTIMFQMINQQIEVALDSNKGSVVAGVVEECVKLLKRRQASWDEVITREVETYLARPEEVNEGLLEYIIAVANDQIKCANYSEATSQKTSSLLSSKYGTEVTQSFDDAIDGFLNTATNCLNRMIDIVFLDLRPAFSALFTPAWYEGGHMTSIISTFTSYIEDPCEPQLDADLFVGLIENFSAQTVVHYLSAVKNKGAKLSVPSTINQIRVDVTIAYQFFSDYLGAELVKNQWFALEHFMKLISADKENLYSEYERFKDKYWDLRPEWVELVVRTREDSRRELVECVKGRQPYGRGDQPTLMAKVGVGK